MNEIDDYRNVLKEIADWAVVEALPEGGLLSAKEFLHLASRAAVDQTLTRLTREGKLMRVGRGTYATPVISRFGARPPSTEAVVKAIESASGEVIVANGATEANALGLTTQVPTREVFLTSGRSRKLQLGNRTVELKHGNRWQLVLGARPAGDPCSFLARAGASILGTEDASHQATTCGMGSDALRPSCPVGWRAR